MKRILLIGASGMLGHDVHEAAVRRGYEVAAPSSEALDVTDPSSVAQIATGAFGRLDLVINCAAYTAVDRAELEVDEATRLNTLAPAYIASACQKGALSAIHVSTDFVFDGRSKEPYSEDDKTNPLGVYGGTKEAGERGFLSQIAMGQVVRTSWLYGPHGPSFPRTMLRAWLSGKGLRVVSDQIGCPTYTADLAECLLDFATLDAESGIYHATGREQMSWHEFTIRTLQTAAEKIKAPPEISVKPIATEDWPTPARRPAYSVLSNRKLEARGVAPMRACKDALDEFVTRLMKIEPAMFER